VGTGGQQLHDMQWGGGTGGQIDVPFKLPDSPDLVLEKYCDDRYGFLRVHVTTERLEAKFYSITSAHGVDDVRAEKIDDFELDLHKHQIV
jgi:hypothetical protein